ncbi:electron transfer flavoprotein subunit beta/FixA family protein [Mucilaginibacter sp. FT3.2]|uniref:electron transfer flavoprotein subunit beta/FixA family protein n=1 Tax=Mucilaginibacter sp. FT3.2 TaxID=2723090 RepID=UPI00161A5252|nr:electron transfer flavoprotein subunit beta/FixA family protein [Mucilaginibacter sp. FT3.2]MBB6229787.1 electron transfer flavoprotein beta subunit [Mucilaginibacter sp. FT3.2]
MKILVCISQVPDTSTKIILKNNNTSVNSDGVTYVINPYDEWYALIRAIELKESGIATQVHLVTVDRFDVGPVIRKALALGGDEAIRIDADNDDPYETANYIAEYAAEVGYDLILCGKESIDYNNGTTGAMLAELLGVDYIGFATGIQVEANTAVVTREIEGGEETDVCNLPVVISCQKGVAEARIPNMRGIMAARTRPLKVVVPSKITAVTKILTYELPPAKAGIKLVSPDNMDELVELLHAETKVI